MNAADSRRVIVAMPRGTLVPSLSYVIGSDVVRASAPCSSGALVARDTMPTRTTTTRSVRHVYVGISWDEVTTYLVASPQSIERAAAPINCYSDRVRFDTDVVAPSTPRQHFAVHEQYAPLWRALRPDASRNARMGHDERLFGLVSRTVRAWESTHTN